MGHDKARPTQEIKRDFRVGHPSSLQARGTREKNEGEEERWERQKNEPKRPEPEPDVVGSDSSTMQLRQLEKKGGPTPTQVNE